VLKEKTRDMAAGGAFLKKGTRGSLGRNVSQKGETKTQKEPSLSLGRRTDRFHSEKSGNVERKTNAQGEENLIPASLCRGKRQF